MNSKEYIARVLETEAKPDKLTITALGLDLVMTMAIAHADALNYIKRAIFYGKQLEKDKLMNALAAVMQTATMLGAIIHHDHLQNEEELAKHVDINKEGDFANASIDYVNKRLLHCVIGKASEVGEMFELLQKQLRFNQFDPVGMGEEFGDDDWYGGIGKDELAILAAANPATAHLDMSEEGIRARNIQKLQDKKNGRYKSGSFSSEEAINRDTQAERLVLEGVTIGEGPRGVSGTVATAGGTADNDEPETVAQAS